MSTNGHDKTITFTLYGQEVEAREGETLWQVAKRLGIDIPHLCYSPEPGYRPDCNCRACMVEIEGERVLAASCIRKPSAGMKVKTASARATRSGSASRAAEVPIRTPSGMRSTGATTEATSSRWTKPAASTVANPVTVLISAFLPLSLRGPFSRRSHFRRAAPHFKASTKAGSAADTVSICETKSRKWIGS